MTVIVEDFLQEDRLRELDPETGQLGSPSVPRGAQGVFMQLGRTLVVLHTADGGLTLRLGAEVVELAGATAELEGGELRTLQILRDGAVIARHVYPNPVHPFMGWDLTMAEEEDFDLGLYVANVLRSPGRRRHVIDQWS
ncbi:MAG: hypothetical protein JRI68_29695 [Deltaproteobacteria bacterium]|nr:hypothetical protein [Deltaproteobacteria bacterium]